MPVGTPVVGTASQSNGAAVAPTRPASIAANDIEVVTAIFYESSGVAPTAITWPAGFTEGLSAAIKNASGTQLGIAGWAWRRAAGGETGTLSVTGGIAGSANGGSIANCFRLPGCVTTGDPFEDSQVANPNYVANHDWPAVAMNRSTGGLLVMMTCNGDNINFALGSSYTALSSNAGTGGLDSAIDIDYRAPGATGTYDPTDVSVVSANAFGWAAFHVVFTDTAGGAASRSLVIPGREARAHLLRR